MKALNLILLKMNFVIKTLGNIVLGAVILTVTLGIVTRYVFNSPLTWTDELASFLMVYLCYVSSFLVTVSKKHIVADFFIAKAPEKFRRAVSFISRGLMVVFFVIICISVVQVMPQLLWKSPALSIPRQWYYVPVIVMSACMLYAVVVDILNELFPGHDLIAAENERLEQEALQAEAAEAAEMQEQMDKFLEETGGTNVSKTEETGGEQG